MIKVDKYNTIPKSLKGAVTKKRRDEIVTQRKYPKSSTIIELEVNRDWLNEERELIYKEFERKVISRQIEYKFGDTDAIIKLKGFIEDFIEESENEIKEYLSFRKYIIQNWLRELLSN